MEKELQDICGSILGLLDDHLVPTASSGESKVFYLKMKGDYHRYLAEFKTGAERKDAAEQTLLAYKAAQDIALVDLPPTHPIRSAMPPPRRCGQQCYGGAGRLRCPGGR